MNKSILILSLFTTVSFLSLAENNYEVRISKRTIPTSSAKAVTYDTPEEIIERTQRETRHK